MRALILSQHYADSQHRGKLRALAGLGVELAVAQPGGTAGLDAGIRFLPIPASGGGKDPASLRWSRRALRRVLSEFRPALVQIEEPPGTQAAAAAAHACRGLAIPHILFSWESLPRRRGLLESRRYAAALDGAAGLIGGNRLATALLAQSAPDRPHVAIPQRGVPAADLVRRATEPRALAMASIGRLVPERGGELLLRACAQLLGAWSLTFIGTGPEQESLEALAQRLGLASRIRWLGGLPRADIEPLWPEVDLLVVPSQDTPAWVEQRAPILLEAMVRGIAPLVTRAGTLPELVGESGWVVDDGEGLALALQELVADPSRARTAGLAARQRVLELFVDAAVARRTLAFWEEVLARRPAAV